MDHDRPTQRIAVAFTVGPCIDDQSREATRAQVLTLVCMKKPKKMLLTSIYRFDFNDLGLTLSRLKFVFVGGAVLAFTVFMS